MKLSDRLKEAESGAAPKPTLYSTGRTASSSSDALGDYKERVHQALFTRLGGRLFDSSLGPDQLIAFVAQEIMSDVIGLGPIERFLADTSVTEVMVNSTDFIYVERKGVIQETTSRFLSEDHLRRVIDRIVAQVGRRIDESSPMVASRLPDGSRVNAIIPPLSVDGPILTIRKFAAEPLRIDDLIGFGTLTPELADFLRTGVEMGLNILISGGTGTGKTTLLNVLSGFIPSRERIITIEDSLELQINRRHVIRLESRPPNIEGRGEVTIRDLVRNSLRMRPDRIVVGEVRGAEALDMLQAMNTGHDGSISTVHCNSPRDALSRVETMVMMSGLDLPSRAIREQVASALDLIVHVHRFRDGSRRVTQVTEVVGMEGDTITMTDLFQFPHAAGVNADGEVVGQIQSTGFPPSFSRRLVSAGRALPAEFTMGGNQWSDATGDGR
ncbi:MAG: CpaF family protein [Actinomycetota bacterium]